MKRKWIDGCNHGDEAYIGTIKHYTPKDETLYDVYVFHDSFLGAEVCLRYGNEGSEYVSPGRVVDLARHSSGNSLYDLALTLINKKGKLRYERRD